MGDRLADWVGAVGGWLAAALAFLGVLAGHLFGRRGARAAAVEAESRAWQMLSNEQQEGISQVHAIMDAMQRRHDEQLAAMDRRYQAQVTRLTEVEREHEEIEQEHRRLKRDCERLHHENAALLAGIWVLIAQLEESGIQPRWRPQGGAA